MMEYGGYFELEQFSGREYHSEGFHRFNYGRTALQCLLIAKEIKKVYCPFFICDSVICAIEQLGIQIEFYPIRADFTPDYAGLVGENEIMIVVNYYGLLSDVQIDACIQCYGRVVVDNTHAFFRRPNSGADAVYSCRKFFGVPDGGYLFTDAEVSSYPADRSESRLDFLVGRLEENASAYYGNYRKAEEKAETEDIKTMSFFTQRILCGINYDHVKKLRTANYKKLHELLGERNALTGITVPEGAYMYPLMVKDEAECIRSFLHKNKVYVPVLWGNVLEMVEPKSIEAQYASKILPLPVDQRYSLEDMEAIANIVKRGMAKC